MCKVCRSAFYTYHSKQRDYCSRKCVAAATRQRYADKRPVMVCEACGKEYEVAPARAAESRFCSRQCANPAVSRETAQTRGDKLRGTGNRTKYLKRFGQHWHRQVAAEKLGRALRPGEVVHHINGNSWDNAPENIVVITQSIHARIHHTKNRKCSVEGCGRKHAAKGYCGKHWRQWRKGSAMLQDIESGQLK